MFAYSLEFLMTSFLLINTDLKTTLFAGVTTQYDSESPYYVDM